MKRILTTLSVALALLTSTQAYAQQHILIEAEQFASCGGWSLDQQFIPQMGSSYLLAHGSGVPVEDAVTTVKVPKTGIWYAYVRTYNWTSPFCPGEGPGRFSLSIDGTSLSTAGTSGSGWEWQSAGKMKLRRGPHQLTLHDHTGLEGRCDAVLLTRIPLSEEQCLLPRPFPVEPAPVKDAGEYDFVVIGAGYSGIWSIFMLLLIISSNSFYYTFANEGQYLTEELNIFENYESIYEQNNQEN